MLPPIKCFVLHISLTFFNIIILSDSQLKPLNMVVQKPVRVVPKAKLRKNLKSTSSENEDVKPLAGASESIALEVLHTMFMKRVAQKSNFVAFQKKKSIVDKLSLKNGVDIVMDQCFDTSEGTSDSESSVNSPNDK